MDKVYDLVIIGGGAAGFSAIVRYNELTEGKGSIALVTRGPLGGTCVNFGCVPSKYLIETAKMVKVSRISKSRGVNLDSPDVDFPSVMGSLRKTVDRLRAEKYESLLGHYPNVDVYRGTARFVSGDRIAVHAGEGEVELRGRNFIVATGSRPFIPPIEGLDKIEYHTTDTIWNIEEKPERMLIVGSGAVGLELAQAFSRLGSDVDVVEVLERPIPSTEPEISSEIERILSGEGISFFFKSRVVSFETKGGAKRAKLAGPMGTAERDYDLVLMATGRRPNTRDLDLEKAGVETNGRGYVKVSKDLRTSNPSILAAGDVAWTGKPALLETLAAKEGSIAAANIALNAKLSIDYTSVPVVVFTDPELAFVGLTEEKVVEAVGACTCRIVRFKSLARSSVVGSEDGLAKIVVDPYSGIIRGIHVLAPNASEYIVGGAMMIKHRYRVQDLIDLVHVFPTSAEILKLAAQAFIRRIDRMPCCVE